MLEITYKPFGPLTGLTYGNGLTDTRTYDQDYRLISITVPNILSWTLGYNLDDDITGFTDNLVGSNGQTLGYDNLNRLNTGSGNSGSLGYIYDADGNRTQGTVNGVLTNYTYGTANNRLTKVNAIARSYDADGNTTGDGAYNYAYDNTNRLASVSKGSTASYVYNGLGQRVEKTVGGTTTVFIYDEAGHLLGEYTPSGTVIAEHIWLNDRPIGVITSKGLYYVHTDQLGTPRVITNASKQLVWEWSSDSFGTTAPNQNPSGLGTFVYNLRMPGQYFDAETGHSQNYFRDYDSTIGRYIESDPIGLGGGINTYAYSGNNPVTNFDPSGFYCTSSGGSTTCNYPGGPSFTIPTPLGFPAYLGPNGFTNSLLYHSYEVSVSTDCSDANMLQALINSPAPGNSISPASANGTPNVAQAFGINNPVLSYITADLNTGDPIVVNVTDSTNGFSPGYVAREVSNGVVQNYGEGLSLIQSPLVFSHLVNFLADQYVWRRQTNNSAKKCGCSQ